MSRHSGSRQYRREHNFLHHLLHTLSKSQPRTAQDARPHASGKIGVTRETACSRFGDARERADGSTVLRARAAGTACRGLLSS
ncbi:hypothetical protein DM46_2103 [Burkholderia mallei]|nr:hypothetical protein DM46_2103 [Burkholderia mallei]